MRFRRRHGRDPPRLAGSSLVRTPLPVTRREAFLAPRLFDEPTMACVPAGGRKTVRYLAFLTDVPTDFGVVRDITLDAGALRVHDDRGRSLAVRSADLGWLRPS